MEFEFPIRLPFLPRGFREFFTRPEDNKRFLSSKLKECRFDSAALVINL